LELLILQQWGTTVGTNYGLGSAESYVGSGNIDIAQVQLCAGGIALPFQPKNYAEELQNCQRYYQRYPATVAYQYFANGNCRATTSAYVLFHLQTKLRIAPSTIENSGNFALEKADGNVQAVTSFANDGLGVDKCSALIGVAANLVAGDATVLISNNDTTAYVGFSAEL
jgi:hypothetical protein